MPYFREPRVLALVYDPPPTLSYTLMFLYPKSRLSWNWTPLEVISQLFVSGHGLLWNRYCILQ